MIKKNLYFLNLWALMVLMILVACSEGDSEGVEAILPAASATETPPPPIEATPVPTVAPTPSPSPTPTPQLAVLVNGQPILLEEFERELARYELAQAELGMDPRESGNDFHSLVLDALVERELIRQAAVVQGITISTDTIDQKMNELREVTSERGNFDDWLAANLYTEEEFRSALEAELVVEKMVAAVTADVPTAMEQVHVRYIQLDNSDRAQLLLGQLNEGVDFADLAQRYSLDQATAPYGGDLGFFARGSLLVPEVEMAAFGLQPEEVSDVIMVTDPDSGLITYYIVKLIERDSSRMLGADLRHRLLQEAFDSWLEELKMGATITKIMVN